MTQYYKCLFVGGPKDHQLIDVRDDQQSMEFLIPAPGTRPLSSHEEGACDFTKVQYRIHLIPLGEMGLRLATTDHGTLESAIATLIRAYVLADIQFGPMTKGIFAGSPPPAPLYKDPYLCTNPDCTRYTGDPGTICGECRKIALLAKKPVVDRCPITPPGFERCTRENGHSGPCAHHQKNLPDATKAVRGDPPPPRQGFA